MDLAGATFWRDKDLNFVTDEDVWEAFKKR